MIIYSNLRSILIVILAETLVTTISCEVSYGYQPEDFPIALINISYIDPVTSLPKVDNEDIGRYGLGKFQDLVGVVAHVTSNNHTSHRACDRLDADRIPREPYIALIKHGECRDHVKLMHAAEANASGVVVYSNHLDSKLMKLGYKGVPTHYINDYLPIFIINKDSPPPIHHHPKLPIRNFSLPNFESLKESFLSYNLTDISPEHQLPYVFISGEKGEEIASLVDNGTRVMMRIVCSMYPSRSHASVLFVSISFVFLMVLLMAWLIFYYIQRFRTIISKDLISKRLCSAAQKALERIPVKTINANEMLHEGEDECCAVCIEPLRPNEVIRILPCQHSFHKICVDPWLLERRSCPMCKLDIVLHFGLVYSGSQESIIEFEETPLHHRRNSQVEMIHVAASRRNSSSQTSPHLEDRATSACVFVQVSEDFINSPIDKAWRTPFRPHDTPIEMPEDDICVAGPSGIGTIAEDETNGLKVEYSMSNQSSTEPKIEEVEDSSDPDEIESN